jgi:hypothetical protein
MRPQDSKKYTGIPGKLNHFFGKMHLPFRITFILMGIASTIWFLVRVIPKPSRATYPCMQTAAPIMSGFVVYLVTLPSSVLAYKLLKRNLTRLRIVPTALALTIIVFSLIISIGNNPFRARADVNVPVAIHTPNEPMGEAVGIMPGRGVMG